MIASFLNEFEEFLESELKQFDNIFFNDIPVLIHSNDMFYLECVLRTQMRNHFKSLKTSTKKTFNGVEFESNEEFLVFDMKKVLSQFSEFNEYIKFLCQNKAIFDTKKMMIVKNIHCVSKTHQLWFSHNITALMRSYGVIATALKTNTVNPQILSHFVPIRRYPHTQSLLTKYAEYTNSVEDTEEIIQTCIKYDKDLLASLMAIHTKSCSIFVEHDIQKIVVSVKKTRNVAIFIGKVRAFVHKFMIYNVPHQHILRAIWHCINTKYKKKHCIRSSLLSELCTLDANLLRASKPLYHYERFFLVLFETVQKS